MRIAPHFTIADLTRTDTGLPNDPGEYCVKNLTRLAADVLEPVRDLLGCKLVISSAFRTMEVNQAEDGAQGSAHLEGRAADFYPETKEAIRLSFERILHSDIPFDKMILEFKKNRYHIHIQINSLGSVSRRQAFLGHATGNGMEYREVSL